MGRSHGSPLRDGSLRVAVWGVYASMMNDGTPRLNDIVVVAKVVATYPTLRHRRPLALSQRYNCTVAELPIGLAKCLAGVAGSEHHALVTEGRQVWKFSVIIEASSADAERVSEEIARALCPDEYHAGTCPVPWTIIRSGFEELDDDERLGWEGDFEAERQQWRDHTDT